MGKSNRITLKIKFGVILCLFNHSHCITMVVQTIDAAGFGMLNSFQIINVRIGKQNLWKTELKTNIGLFTT